MAIYRHYDLARGEAPSERFLLSEDELIEKLEDGYCFSVDHSDKYSDVIASPALHSGRGLGGGLKVDSGFNDILNRIKSGNSVKGGWSKSTIQTK
jgi:hypothetical protein